MTQPITELLIKPITQNGSPGDSLLITPESVGFQYLTFRVRRLIKGERFAAQTDINELGMVVLGGRCSVESSAGSWSNFGGRAHVFDGLPYVLYLPIQTSFTVIAETDCEIAFCLCRAEEQYQAHLVTPEQIGVEIRGGANATRQINHILKPEFPAQRLLIVEVYTLTVLAGQIARARSRNMAREPPRRPPSRRNQPHEPIARAPDRY